MKYIADLHIHSHFSLATSKELTPEFLDLWGMKKGIKVIGTGDFSHPGWVAELKSKLEPAEPGLFRLKNEFRQKTTFRFPDEAEVRFVLSAEISNIYKKDNKVRKIHNIILAPDFEVAEKIQRKLLTMKFNITSDGRPILGLDAKKLLGLCLQASPDIFFIPAHIWTPWFSVLGANSGFNSVEECFEDLTSHIYAVETGLSTDAPMNWMCSFLDKYTLLSNSDAHSPEKLGRNANILNTDISYNSLIDAIKGANPEKFLGTIDMFPQEGKYHFDGHRKCNICWSPVDTLKNDKICPVCGKKVTVGVAYRVAELSDRVDILERPNRLPFYSIIPLKEILSEILDCGPDSKVVFKEYESLLAKTGTEFDILLNLPLETIQKSGGELLGEAISRMRKGEIYIKEGFDGEFGVIKVFKPGELKSYGSSENIFAGPSDSKPHMNRNLLTFDLKEYKELSLIKQSEIKDGKKKPVKIQEFSIDNLFGNLNPEQKAAALHGKGPALVLAGPGTGKTRVLTIRIANMLQNMSINAGNILAVTFTNKAAAEMQERLSKMFEDKQKLKDIHISTFHALGLSILKKHFQHTGRTEKFTIIDDAEQEFIVEKKLGIERSKQKKYLNAVSKLKQDMKVTENVEDEELAYFFKKYNGILIENNLFDFDDLIYLPYQILSQNPLILKEYQGLYKWILVDEYQDINYSQYHFINLLSGKDNPNLFVIGDPNQSIYGFRGADIKFIQKFKDDYKDSRVYHLTKSYRCSDLILKASSNIIDDYSAKQKIVLEGIDSKIKVAISKNNTDKSEAEFVARTIEKMIGGLRFFSMDSKISEGEQDADIESLSDFAVLARTSQQFDAIIKAFHDHSIPYQTVGEKPFFMQPPIKEIIDIIKLSVNPSYRFLFEQVSEKIKFPEKDLKRLQNFAVNSSLIELINYIIDFFFGEYREKHDADIKMLLEFAAIYENKPDDFIKAVSLGTSVDLYRQEIEKVVLMTLHASKGLEFNCVFIIGCEKGLIPYSLYENQTTDFDEERRLLYVGMTRAKKYLYLSHAENRIIRGRELNLPKSPFLNKIEKNLLEDQASVYRKKKDPNEGQLKLFEL